MIAANPGGRSGQFEPGGAFRSSNQGDDGTQGDQLRGAACAAGIISPFSRRGARENGEVDLPGGGDDVRLLRRTGGKSPRPRPRRPLRERQSGHAVRDGCLPSRGGGHRGSARGGRKGGIRRPGGRGGGRPDRAPGADAAGGGAITPHPASRGNPARGPAGSSGAMGGGRRG